MEFLKSLFESGAIDWDTFSKAVSEKGFKLADLSTGNYVAKKKYEDELKVKDTTIADLNTQISTRDTDITTLKTQIENGGADTAKTIEDLKGQISKYQTDYATAKTDYETKLSKQQYEFAVREFANSKEFTSKAAKKNFINEMVSQNLQMKDKAILGADDFVKSYIQDDPSAFVVKKEEPDVPEPTPDTPKPTFVQPTPPQPTPEPNAFTNAFNFTGVRPHENK